MTEELALPTKKSIRIAAEKCPEAKEVLEVLFPKVFKKEKTYCCNTFMRAVESGDIRKGTTMPWVFGGDWIITYCPFCGKKPVTNEVPF